MSGTVCGILDAYYYDTRLTCIGYRFVIRRAGGWLSTPIIIDIVAVDGGGNVTTETFE